VNILTWILIAGGALVLTLLVVGIAISVTSERSIVEERLERFLEEEQGDTNQEGETSILTDWFNRSVEKSSIGDRLARQLARADMKFKVGEYVALIGIAMIGLGGVVWLIGGRQLLSFLIGAIVGFFIPGFYVRRQQSQRLHKFNDQLADMLNLVVNGLRAGYSTMQAMEAISRELPAPISDEFRRVVQEMQFGVPMERALDNLLRRIPSDDLDFVITAINVQREVGGNLSEILDTISFTIRERVRIKGEIRVLTAQVRQSGQFLSLIPIILTVVLYFINPEYLGTFFEDSFLCGVGALGFAAFLIVTGYFVMQRIANIEV
jgi:tight adherence protein B